MNEGDVVGERYVIERLLGSGGMAEVFRARDRLSGERVALKMFPPGNAERRVRFEREAEVLAGLSHPGIVRYLGHGAPPEGELYLVMEYLEGEDLFERLGRGPLSVEETLVVARGVASALSGAHARGILHRDIKPANLFLVGGDVGALKILDFGIARIAPSSTLTQAGFSLGTPDYMSPEQARGDAILTPAVDVFALGCVLFECLVGRPPFVADHPLAILSRILLESAPRVSANRPDVPKEVDDLVDRMLAKNPEARPPSAGALLPLLDHVGRSGESSTRRQPPPTLTNRELRVGPPTRPRERDHTAPIASRTLLGRAQPFVGRDDDIAAILNLFDASMHESAARAVLVTGPPGIGKSRLRTELSRTLAARAASAFAVVGRGDPSRAGEPFGLVASALRTAFGLRFNEPLAARQERILLYVAAALPDDGDSRAPPSSRPDIRSVAEFLGELLGTPFESGVSPLLLAARADGIRMGDHMWRAFHAFVDGVTRRRPLVFVLDDLDSTDLPSLSYLDAELRNLHDRRLFVLAFARPEVDARFPNLWSERALTRIALGPLDHEASTELVRDALGPETEPSQMRAILDRAGGNPLFLEEMVRAVSSGAVDSLPPTVVAMVEARLEALSPEARRVLRAASIFGRVSWRSAIGALCGGTPELLDGAFDDLVAREILVKRDAASSQGETEFAFRHGLVRDVAYAMLTEEDRTLGHDLAGRWLAEARPQEALIIADHFSKGAQPRAAMAWYERSAELALEGNDFASAVERAGRAIACGAEGLALGKLQLLVSECHRHKGANVDMVAAAEEAREILVPGTVPWFRAMANVILGAIRLGKKEAVDECIRDLGRELGKERETPFPAAAARIAHYLHFAGHHSFATRLLSRAWTEGDTSAGETSEAADAERAAWFHRACATRALVHGDLGSYLEHIERAVSSFELAGDVREPASERVNVGYARLELGLYAEAEATLRRALDDAGALGLLHTAATAKENLGAVLTRLGKLDEAEPHLQDAIAAFARQKNRRMEGNARVYLGELWIRAGDLTKAETELRAAVELLASVKPLRPMAQALLAEVLLLGRRLDEAWELADTAFRSLEEIGHLDEGEGLVRLARAEVLLARGMTDEARVAADAARQAVLERAGRIREPAWRSTFLAIDENARALALASSLEETSEVS